MNKKEANILIVDDDKFILFSMKRLFEKRFNQVITTLNPEEIPELLKQNIFHVALLDMNFAKGNTSGDEGIYWIKSIKEIDPLISLISITAYGEIEKAVRAIRAGALDFVVKPWENEKLLSTTIAAAELCLSKRKIDQLRNQQLFLTENINKQFSDIVYGSKGMNSLIDQIKKIAPTEANVLIKGENGTGKELIARAIHNFSLRSQEAFINVDMGSISESLFESELFGHTKGSFTDAKTDRIGRFEAASGGTLFLDEITNTPPALQSKLLKVLQERKVNRIGSHLDIPVDIRLISASNLPIQNLINTGRFRQDLFYRINTVELEIPPLRERLEDIPLLAEHFLKIYKQKYGKPGLQLPEYVVNKLQKFEWPGNVRELQHAIERAVIMSDGKAIKSNDFNFLLQDTTNSSPSKEQVYNLEQIEKQAIEKCIRNYAGNLTKAAKELGLTRGSLYRRIEKYGL